MTRKLSLLSLALIALLIMVPLACAPSGTEAPTGAAEQAPESEKQLVERARGIHERVITLDTHVDISVENFTAETNYTTDLPSTQVDLPSMEEGGLDVAFLIVYTGQGELTEEGYAAAHANAIAKFEAIHRLTEEIAPDRIGLATSSEDVRRLVAEGKKVAMIGVENAYPVGRDLDNIRDFAERGARYMSLSHNGHSQFADSNTGERDGDWLHGGLSELGEQAVAELNRWGVMIDVSHPAKTSNMRTFELTRAPVIASHSAARAVSDVSRNLDDEELRALAATGGVVQTVAFASYVDSDKARARRDAVAEIEAEVAAEMGIELRERSELRAMSGAERRQAFADLQRVRAAARERAAGRDDLPPAVDVADFVDQIDYLVDLIGIEHVGISSDFDGGGGVEGWNDASETFNVTLELVRRGYTEEEIAMIWSGNLLRALDEVQRIGEEIRAGE